MSDTIRLGDFAIRSLQLAKDLPAIKRIWGECGWLCREGEDLLLEDLYALGHSYAATLDERVECVGQSVAGEMRYQDDSLVMAAITTVITSILARQRGLAKAVTSRLISQIAEAGAEVATLGMFEQGFYDQLGFGTGSYEHVVTFDPANLKPCGEHRIPKRLVHADWETMHRAMKNRWLSHGGCTLLDFEHSKVSLGWIDAGWGLGYLDDQGDLTHFFYGKLADRQGPLEVHFFAYRNGNELRELLSLIRSLRDQVRAVKMVEPPHVQLQDFLVSPLRSDRLAEPQRPNHGFHAAAFWQTRILDLPACISKTHFHGQEIDFNLVLTDPIGDHLPANRKWRGVAGEYVITFGEDSLAKPGTDPTLPSLHASVGAFTRLWLGVRPATELAISDELEGDTELLEELSACLLLPQPKLGWYF